MTLFTIVKHWSHVNLVIHTHIKIFFYYFLNIQLFLICGSKIIVLQKYYQEVSNLDNGNRSAHVDYKVVTSMKMTTYSQKLDLSIKFTALVYLHETKNKRLGHKLTTNFEVTYYYYVSQNSLFLIYSYLRHQ